MGFASELSSVGRAARPKINSHSRAFVYPYLHCQHRVGQEERANRARGLLQLGNARVDEDLEIPVLPGQHTGSLERTAGTKHQAATTSASHSNPMLVPLLAPAAVLT